MKTVFYYVLHLVIQAGTCWLFSSDHKSDKYMHIGIDLGTTYSCVGVFKKGKVDLIADEHGNRCIPSCVAFTEDGRLLVGDDARRQLTSNPETTICDVKRFIGRTYGDPSVENDKRSYPFLILDKDDELYFEIKTAQGLKTFVPEEITAMILVKLKEMAEDYLGSKVYNAVVTVPAYFNDAQRSATMDAVTIAGFETARLMNEPSVAAIAHWNARQDAHLTMIVFDLGGGTFDVSLIKFDEGMFSVVATKGNTHLGGKDFDQRVMNHFFQLYKKKTGKEIRKDKLAVQKLRREVEWAKIALSSVTRVRLEIESFLDGQTFNETLTRAEFEELNMDLFGSIKATLKLLLEDADLKVGEVDDIVLVGGSTRIPKIQHLVTEFFNGKKPSQNVNPSEAVTIGATIQAGILSREEQSANIIFTDVNSFSVGYETASGSVMRLIPRRTILPATSTETTGTARDNQKSMTLDVYEGDSLEAKDNRLIGRYNTFYFEPAPRGFIEIIWTFEIDLNGILKVFARDKRNGKQSDTVIKNVLHRLSRKDIKRITMEIEQLKEKDRKFRGKEKTRQDLENTVYFLKHHVRDEQRMRGRLAEGEKELLSEFLEENIVWLDNNSNADMDDVKLRKAKLDEVCKPILDYLKDTAKVEL